MNLLPSVLDALMTFGRPHDPIVEQTEWDSFKLQYNKSYPDAETEATRRSVFAENKKLVETLNEHQDHLGYTVGINHLSDWSQEEVNSILNGLRHTKRKGNSLEAEQFLQSIYDSDAPVPDEVDWRKVPGRVTPVKDQGSCGSCWTFGTTGVLEGQEKLRANVTGDLIPLSEQQIIDCTRIDYGCTGGIIEDALDFVKVEGGIDDEKTYPYSAADGKICKFVKSKSVMSVKGWAITPEGDEKRLKEIVAKFGPVAVGIDANQIGFVTYKSGVFYGPTCTDRMNHAVLVVGYGTDPQQGDYWLVKNSWTANWGDHGYIKMARNRNNNCLIATNAVIPTF